MPPFRFEAYTPDPSYTTTAAQLLQGPAQAQARAIETGARARANALTVSGQANAAMAGTIGTTARDLLNLPATLQANRIARTKMQLEDAEGQDELAIQQAESKHGGDAEAVQAELQQTRPTAAGKFAARERAQHLQTLQENKLQTDVAFDNISKISQILDGVNAVPAEQRPAAYAKARDQILKVLPAQGHGEVPLQFDQAYVDQAISEGRSTKDKLDLLRESNIAAERANTTAKTKLEIEQFHTEAAAKRLMTADNQADVDQITADLKAQGVPSAIITRFPATFSPDFKTKVAKLLPATEANAYVRQTTPADPMSLDGFTATYARDVLKKPVDQMTASDKLRAKSAFDAAGRQPGDDENRQYTRDRQAYQDYVATWNKEHPVPGAMERELASVMGQGDKVAQVPTYTAPPDFETWRASRSKPPSPARAKAKALLDTNGYDSSEAAIDAFLKKPANRAAVGLK